MKHEKTFLEEPLLQIQGWQLEALEVLELLPRDMKEQDEMSKSKEIEPTIKHEGDKIVLPIIDHVPMSYSSARKWLKRKEEEENEPYAVMNVFPCSPLDGLVAFHRALAEKYGWTNMVPTPGFFGGNPPKMVGVAVGPGETMQVPYGRVEVPGINGYLETHFKLEGTPGFVIGGEVLKKHKKQVQEIADLTRKFLKEQSIYKGRAVKVDFSWKEDKGHMDPIDDAPKFMHLDQSLADALVFSDRVQNDLEIGLFTPIEQSEACRQYDIPLKRGILLHGPYGTGKTLTANVTALKAEQNGWTFVYLSDVRDIKEGLEFAAQYAPAVVFAEDIDRAVKGERSAYMDSILNTLDGVDTKKGEVITVFTTNHVDQINPALLRQGRLDSLIEVSPPDAEAAIRLVKYYSRGLLKEDTDLASVGQALSGKIPAFIREVVERSKIAAVARLGGKDIRGHVCSEDMLKAATAMESHDALVNPNKVKADPVNLEFFFRVPPGHKNGGEMLRKAIAEAKTEALKNHAVRVN